MICLFVFFFFFFSSRRRHTRCGRDWSSDVCSSDLIMLEEFPLTNVHAAHCEQLQKVKLKLLLVRVYPSWHHFYSVFAPVWYDGWWLTANNAVTPLFLRLI